MSVPPDVAKQVLPLVREPVSEKALAKVLMKVGFVGTAEREWMQMGESGHVEVREKNYAKEKGKLQTGRRDACSKNSRSGVEGSGHIDGR